MPSPNANPNAGGKKPTNPGQKAQDDLYNRGSGFLVISEDGVHNVAVERLLSNDLGGAATFLGLGNGTLTSLRTTLGGQVSVTNGIVTYDPADLGHLPAGAEFEDTFTYTIRLKSGATSTATVKVLIKGANDAPESAADTFSFTEDQPLQGGSVLLNDDDPDDGATLTAVLVDGAEHGDLILNADGTFTFTPDANYAGTDTFTYRAFDGSAYSAVTTVTLNGIDTPDGPQTFTAQVYGVIVGQEFHPDDYSSSRVEYLTPGFEHRSWHLENPMENQSFILYKGSGEEITGLGVTKQYLVANNHYGPVRETAIDRETGQTYVVESESHTVYHEDDSYQAVLEYDVSDASGLVSGGTLDLDVMHSYGNRNVEDVLSEYDSGTVEVYLYGGDGAITVGDLNAGTLAGSADFALSTEPFDLQVALDADVLNGILSGGSDWIGINLRMVLPDDLPGDAHFATSSTSFNFYTSTAGLSLIYS